ncbi:MAG: hypothetical protein WDN00_02295 [Limisphaerales bacterium]
MEPERKIEKWLHDYAKKRRADAGDPLKLHPATRRLLQSEVARRKPKPDDEKEASVSLWELFHRHGAFLTLFVMVFFFFGLLTISNLNKAKMKANKVATVSNLKQIGLAMQTTAKENYGNLPTSLDVLTNALGSDKVLTDPQTGKPFIYVAGGENLGQLSSNSLLAYSSTDKKDRAALFADGRVEVVNGARLAELTNRGLLQLVAAASARPVGEMSAAATIATGNAATTPVAPIFSKSETARSAATLSDSVDITNNADTLAANAPAPAASAFSGPAKERAGAAKDLGMQTGSVQFTATQNYNSSAQNSFKNTSAPAKSAVVLANFQVQQAGNAIRLVDSDGSVYDGELQPDNEAKEKTPSGILQAPADQTKSFARRDEPQMTQNSQAAQNFSFRVTGTNLTLKQNVVFAGSVLANSKQGGNQQQAFDNKGAAGGAQSQSLLKNQLLWSDSRIAGTAVVANTNNIEINAEPQSP